jgi:hypothetical protein
MTEYTVYSYTVALLRFVPHLRRHTGSRTCGHPGGVHGVAKAAIRPQSVPRPTRAGRLTMESLAPFLPGGCEHQSVSIMNSPGARLKVACCRTPSTTPPGMSLGWGPKFPSRICIHYTSVDGTHAQCQDGYPHDTAQEILPAATCASRTRGARPQQPPAPSGTIGQEVDGSDSTRFSYTNRERFTATSPGATRPSHHVMDGMLAR